jgi:hypothetical protein
MQLNTLQELRDKNLITEEQFVHLNSIYQKKIFSVFYELRTLLYLGVLLFTSGIGLLIYENIGQIGHVLSIIALFVLTIACFAYAFWKAPSYTQGVAVSPSPYFDYVVLLGCLLLISVQGYMQYQFGIFTENLGASTLITSVIFFLAAYRFDHAGVLSLAITAFASFWSISISPQKWYSGDFFETANLHVTAIFFGGGMVGAAMLLDSFSIKRHFTFTYVNFATLIFFAGGLTGLFSEELSFVYALVLLAGCGFAVWFAHRKKSFLFLLYAFVVAYITITYLLSDIIVMGGIWFFYMMASCGGFVFFIVRFKNYFKREE